MLPAQPNQSLIDGLAVLQALASQEEAIGSRELGRRLGLEPTRVNRLLKTLAYVGLAEQDERGKYRSGPAIHVLAAQSLFGSGLLRRAISPLETLLPLGHVVAMGVLWRDQTCYLYHATPQKDEEMHGLGHRRLYPAVSSGLGMMLLAHRPEDEVRDLYAEPSGGARGLQLEGEGGLLERLDQIREQGYALVSSPEGPVETLGVGLGDPPYAAIGLSGSFAAEEIGPLVGRLRDVATHIENAGR